MRCTCGKSSGPCVAVAASVRWQFTWHGFEIQGAHEMRCAEQAKVHCETMNDLFGTGTHWVELSNQTWAEARAS